MGYRRHSLISQPALPGMEVDPYLAWLRLQKPKPAARRKRKTAAEKRVEAARRDPRQVSIFGPQHTDELTGW